MKKEAFWKRNKCRLAMAGTVIAAVVAAVLII